MELVINIDQIKEAGKREWLLNTLKLMGIRFDIEESAQTIEEYNNELIVGDREIENGNFTKAVNLKKEITRWR